MSAVAPLRTWLALSHVTVLALPVVVVVGTGILSDELRSQTEADLQHQAALVALLVEVALDDALAGDPGARLDDLGSTLGPVLVRARERTLAGLRVVDHSGVVVASSGEELGLDLSDRPEVAAALAGAVALDVRDRPAPTANPLDSDSRRATVRLFLGAPLRHDGQTIGAVVLSRTPREEVQALYQALPWWAVTVPVALTLLIAAAASRLFSRSLVLLAGAAGRVAEGDFAASAGLERPRSSHVAEVQQLTAALDTMAARLLARLTYITEFAGNVSHEFRTPMSTLRATLELLEDDPDMPSAQRHRFLANATAELDRLDRLVTGLLALARAEEGAQRRRVDLDALAAQIAARFGDVAVQGGAGAVDGDPAQLASALDNLLENALRHGGEGAQVSVTLERAAGRARLSVQDDGPGIAPANLPRVFDRFFTTARDAGGTGLGLALVRAVARAHGGDALVRSRPGHTVVTLDLPALDEGPTT